MQNFSLKSLFFKTGLYKKLYCFLFSNSLMEWEMGSKKALAFLWGRRLCRLAGSLTLFVLQDCSWNQKVDPKVHVYLDAPLTTPISTDGETGGPFCVGFWPTQSWWEVFDDPCLSQCILTALEQNPDLMVAKSRVEEAFQIARREGGPRWVQAEIDGDINFAHLSKNGLYRTLNPSISPNALQIDLNGILSYEVDIWGQYYETWMSAFNRFQSSEAKKSFVEVDISTRVAEVYFVLQSLIAQIAELEKWVASQKEIIRLSQTLLKNKIIDQIQMEIEYQALEGLNKDLESLTTAKQIQSHLLAVLMGNGPDALFPMSATFKEPLEKLEIPTNLALGLLKRRPDLAADILYLTSLERDIKIARTLFYPNINIIGSGGIQNLKGGVFSPSSLQGSFLPSFTLPIFTGFRLEGNLGAAIKAYEAGIHQYNANVLKASQQVKDAVSNIEGVVLNIGYQKNLLQEEMVKLDLTNLLFKNRIASKIRLDVEQNRVYEKWITLYNLYRQRYQYHIQLIRTLGGGYVQGGANG
jgi:NodT family efflux transporter outer membrane factor (OMF) lipoprotein